MAAEVSTDLYESLKSINGENVEEYDIELLKNEKGQGFLGEILFITLTHRTKEEKKHLIAKQDQNGEINQDGIPLNELVQNEINFYGSIWPYLQKFYKSVSGKDLNILPKCFGTSNAGCKRIFLENIKPMGFELYEKQKPFDDEHIRALFKTYGMFHGVSMALKEKDYEKYEELVSKQINLLLKTYNTDNFFFRKYKGCYLEAQNYFDPVREKVILEKLRVYSDFEPILQILKEDLTNRILIHGDCWSNNFMFKYDEKGKVQDLKIIDFQISCDSTPIYDLAYCLYSGATGESLKKLDDYQRIYHDSLTETLEEFGISAERIYSFDTFKEDWKKYCKLGLSPSLFLWKVKLFNNEDLPNPGESLNVSLKLSSNFQERYRKIVRDLVIHMYNNDFL